LNVFADDVEFAIDDVTAGAFRLDARRSNRRAVAARTAQGRIPVMSVRRPRHEPEEKAQRRDPDDGECQQRRANIRWRTAPAMSLGYIDALAGHRIATREACGLTMV
jgi:hypothetical protein